LESERFGFFGHYFVVLYMNESFCAFLFMTKKNGRREKKKKKRETRFFFFPLRVLTRLKSVSSSSWLLEEDFSSFSGRRAVSGGVAKAVFSLR